MKVCRRCVIYNVELMSNNRESIACIPSIIISIMDIEKSAEIKFKTEVYNNL